MISKKARKSSRKLMTQRNSWGRSNHSRGGTRQDMTMPSAAGMTAGFMGALFRKAGRSK